MDTPSDFPHRIREILYKNDPSAGSYAAMFESYNQQAAAYANHYKPPTEEELKQQEEERMLEQQRKDENLAKAKKCFAGTIVLAALMVFFFTFNLSFENHDYNTKLLSAFLWFVTVCSAGFATFLIVIGLNYCD